MSQTVANRSPEQEKLLLAGAAGRALMSRTAGMRAEGETYLPRFPAESPEAYKARLQSSFLFNGYRKTVKDMTGRVFDKPVEIAEGAIPDDIAANVDLLGHDLSVFARGVFEKALAGAGIAYILADAPARPGAVTQAQVQAQGLRPYLVALSVEDVLGWQYQAINNVPTLTQLRIMESVATPDPKDEFGQVNIEQVRVLDRTDSGVQVRLLQKQGKDPQWTHPDEPVMTGLDRITLTPVILEPAGFMMSEPPLQDLADLNVAHWQSSSDQRNILHYARVPFLFASGHDDSAGKLVVAPGQVTTSADPQARMTWVEHSGAAIEAGRQDLKDLEFQMQALGMQLLVARQETATGAALDAKKETSPLAMMADALQDALENALGDLMAYLGQDSAEVAVTVNKDFGVSQMGAQEMQAMLMAVNTGNMSRETFLREMARRGMVRADLDPLDEAERIDNEGGGLTDGGQ